MHFDDDALITDPKVWEAFSVTPMTGHRWTHDQKLNFPQAIKINGRNYRQGRELNQFVARKVRESLEQRSQRGQATEPEADRIAQRSQAEHKTVAAG
jgi:hypothetical protein